MRHKPTHFRPTKRRPPFFGPWPALRPFFGGPWPVLRLILGVAATATIGVDMAGNVKGAFVTAASFAFFICAVVIVSNEDSGTRMRTSKDEGYIAGAWRRTKEAPQILVTIISLALVTVGSVLYLITVPDPTVHDVARPFACAFFVVVVSVIWWVE